MTITTYEHSTLRYGKGQLLTEKQWKALIAFRSVGTNMRYFDVVHCGIKLGSYVGVLQIGELTIEVLPKLDGKAEDVHWRNRLLDMLGVVQGLNAHHPSAAPLRIRPNNLLEHYLLLFANELEQLLRGGLVRAYHERRGNQYALRGRLKMARHLRENMLHRERFYVADTTYDFQHPLNQILRMALDLAKTMARTGSLRQRLAELDLMLPNLPGLRINEGVFRRLRYDRRTSRYRPAIAIARLLLLNFHPDLKNGQNDVLALLFNMNRLWEGFLLACLRRFSPPDLRFSGQHSDLFWRGKHTVSLRPDILVFRGGQPLTVFDAKWKITEKPNSGDLYQLYAYASHFGAKRVALIYPATEIGHLMHIDEKEGVAAVQLEPGKYANDIRCDVLRLPVSKKPLADWMSVLAEGMLSVLEQH